MHSQSTSKNAILDISVETNVYVQPRTDVGFRETKAGIIIQVRGKNIQRKLPEQDCLYVTIAFQEVITVCITVL